MPIAGPVFTEWYWTPIFFVLFYGPPILVVAGVLHMLLRRTGWRRSARAAAALLAAPVLVLGGFAVKRTVEHRRTEAAEARGIAFATFEARGLHRTRAEVYGGAWPSLHMTYERGGRELWVAQEPTRGDDVTPPYCELRTGAGDDGPCRAVRTRGGQVVALARTPGLELMLVRDGTVIVAGSYDATEADLLAFADALVPVDPEDIHWER